MQGFALNCVIYYLDLCFFPVTLRFLITITSAEDNAKYNAD